MKKNEKRGIWVIFGLLIIEELTIMFGDEVLRLIGIVATILTMFSLYHIFDKIIKEDEGGLGNG